MRALIIAITVFLSFQASACLESFEKEAREARKERIKTNFEMGLCGYGKLVNLVELDNANKVYISGVHNLLKARAYRNYSNQAVLRLIIQPQFFSEKTNAYTTLQYEIQFPTLEKATEVKNDIVSKNASVSIEWQNENTISLISVITKESTKNYTTVRYLN
jgi:hypothetical protein